MKKFINRWSRKLHRWGAVICCLPMLVVIVSGLLLQVKKQVPWVQPPTARGTVGTWIGFDEILRIAAEVPESGVTSWEDVDRLDVRPGRNLVKVRGVNRWELQIDLATGEVVHSAYRRSDWIESFHDGTWFGDAAKLWVFLPNGLILAGLWLTGMYLWALPIYQKRANRRKRSEVRSSAGPATSDSGGEP